jgi:glycosyltransferase involved in cell wall biosynthesis
MTKLGYLLPEDVAKDTILPLDNLSSESRKHKEEHLSLTDQKALRIAWLVKGNDAGGVTQAVRGLMEAVRPHHIAPSAISLRGGPMVEMLQSINVPVQILPLDDPPTLRGNLFSRAKMFTKIHKHIRMLVPEVLQAVREEHVDAIHVLRPNLCPVAGAVAKQAEIPCFWEMINALGKYPLNINRRMIQNQLLRDKVTVLANSRYSAESLGDHPVKPILLYLGADPDRFNPDRIKPVTRASLGIPEDALVLGIIARLNDDKGQNLILQTMASLIPEFDKLHLLLAGRWFDDSFVRKLHSMARALRVADRMHMLQNVPDPERYYGAIDLPINPRPDAEPFGLSVVEAMMMGKPVLVHALGGPAETVIDGVTGWHVHKPTVTAFRAGIQRALADRPRWPEMGAAARKHALEHFNLKRQAGEYAAIVRNKIGC